MPTYDYVCTQCGNSFVEIHSIKGSSKGCPKCNSLDIKKSVSQFASKTERTVERALEKYEKQGMKDIERFHKDDKFAANITGADDPEHQRKLKKVLDEQHKKNEIARQKIKRKNNE